MSETVILVGDAGGTHVRFALAFVDHSAGRAGIKLSPIWKKRGEDYATFDAALDAYLGETRPELAGAAFGFAGAVRDGRVDLLNRNWSADRRALEVKLDVDGVIMVNDFFAMSRAAPELPADELVTLARGEADPEGAIAVGGPGTGFGIGVLRRFRDGWVVVAGEGGHQSFGPQTDLEWRVAEGLRARDIYPSNEIVAAGAGFAATRDALAEALGLPASSLSPAAIMEAADAGDAFAVEFCRLRARTVMTVMGNLALSANASGGVFLAGGVTQRLRPWLNEPEARARFFQRGPRTELLSRFPIQLIASETAPLIGATHLWRDQQSRGWL
jgi:glucokinase